MIYKTPPTVITAEVFARLPDVYRRPGVPSPWADANRPGVPTDCFLEGPSFDRDGNLYVVDIPFGRIFRISSAGEFSLVVEYDGQPNGLKIHRDGMLYVADYQNGIVRIDPESGAVEHRLANVDSESFKGCNDLYFGRDGALYFTDQGQTGMHDPSGRVYRWHETSGRLDCLIDNVPSPNGLLLNADESVLFLAVTRANAVWRIPLRANGRITKAGVYQQLSGGRSGPDGLAMDRDGGLFVCHAGLGTVWGFDPLGYLTRIIEAPAGLGTTNCAFGGPDHKTLYVVESDTGTILKAELEVPGVPLFSHM